MTVDRYVGEDVIVRRRIPPDQRANYPHATEEGYVYETLSGIDDPYYYSNTERINNPVETFFTDHTDSSNALRFPPPSNYGLSNEQITTLRAAGLEDGDLFYYIDDGRSITILDIAPTTNYPPTNLYADRIIPQPPNG